MHHTSAHSSSYTPVSAHACEPQKQHHLPTQHVTSQLTSVQYMDLTGAPLAKDPTSCRKACCDAGELSCDVWMWWKDFPSGPPCWYGLKGRSMPSTKWIGEARPGPPPPPPPPPPSPLPPQRFLTTPIGVQPSVLTMDLASDTEWSASVDGAPPRPIKVPGGGYNSDSQEQPWCVVSCC